MISKKWAVAGLLLMSRLAFSEETSLAPPPISSRFEQVDLPVQEKIDGVSNGIPQILSVMVASTGDKIRWNIVLVDFEADDINSSEWTTVYRTGSSSDLPIFPNQKVARLHKWIPGNLIEFDNIKSGPYSYGLTLKRKKTKTGKLVWSLDCVGTYKKSDSDPVQKFEMMTSKEVEIEYKKLKTVDSDQQP